MKYTDLCERLERMARRDRDGATQAISRLAKRLHEANAERLEQAAAAIRELEAERDGAQTQYAEVLGHANKQEDRAEAAEARVAELTRERDAVKVLVKAADQSFFELVVDGMAEADRAMRKFPQPNYVISKVAEEAGEVVKAAIHCAEGRETAANVQGEMKQLIAMLYRLWVEGDQVHGLAAIRKGATP